MPSVRIVWKGHCRSEEARARLLSNLHQLARLSDGYLRPADRPMLTVVGEGQHLPRANVERIDSVRKGEILISTEVSEQPETMVLRAREVGLEIRNDKTGKPRHIVLDEVHIRGIDFKLFDPRGLCPGNDRMSFVFIECPERHFLNGRLVKITEREDSLLLECPDLRLNSYLEDWTDCLFAWTRFFLMGDLWWKRHEELQGYHDYRGVLEELQTSCGSLKAEAMAFEAVLSTFMQHAEYWRCEAEKTG
ncbi:MAG: hypothetical protein AAF405_03300 [Pseudomonadota bacterium]